MLNWFLRPDSKNLSNNGYHNVSLVGKHLALSSKKFNPAIFKTNQINISLKDFESDQYENLDFEYLHHIVEMKKFVNDNMSDLVSNFILHGSMATLDYSKGWSDVDTLVIVPRDTLTNTKKLLRLRELSYEAHKFLYRVDPLQHHGLIFISDCDVSAYPSHYLPPEVLKKSVSLIEDKKIVTLNIRNSKKECIEGILSRIKLIRDAKSEGIFRHHAYNGEYLLENYKNSQNGMYQMKYFLGTFSILPSLVLCVLGSPCYKGDSFDIAKKIFSHEAWEVVNKVSKIRMMWQEKELYPYNSNNIPLWLIAELGEDYFSIGDKMLKEIENICKGEL
jgi:predicted nucleotidyltransferase